MRGGGKELREAERQETFIRMYYMRKKSTANKKKKKKRVSVMFETERSPSHGQHSEHLVSNGVFPGLRSQGQQKEVGQ